LKEHQNEWIRKSHRHKKGSSNLIVPYRVKVKTELGRLRGTRRWKLKEVKCGAHPLRMRRRGTVGRYEREREPPRRAVPNMSQVEPDLIRTAPRRQASKKRVQCTSRTFIKNLHVCPVTRGELGGIRGLKRILWTNHVGPWEGGRVV